MMGAQTIRRTGIGWRVENYDLAREVLLDSVRFTVDDPRFSTGAVLGESMLSTDGDAHRAHRSRFAPDFRSRTVAALEERIVELAEGLLDDGVKDFRGDFAGPLAVMVMIETLGLDIDPADLLACYRSIVVAVAEYPDRPERADHALRRLREAMGEVDDAYFSNVAVILFGGVETVEGLIVNSLWMIYRDPELRDRLVADPSLISEAVEEALRVYPSVVILHRYATEDAQIGGAYIAKGELVEVSIPESATADKHLAFATGPHVCIGLHLARLEARLAVRAVLRRFPSAVLDLERSSEPTGEMFRKTRWLGFRSETS